jgi:hypothetical protein
VTVSAARRDGRVRSKCVPIAAHPHPWHKTRITSSRLLHRQRLTPGYWRESVCKRFNSGRRQRRHRQRRKRITTSAGAGMPIVVAKLLSATAGDAVTNVIASSRA